MFHYYSPMYIALFLVISMALLGLSVTRHRRRASIAARALGRQMENSIWVRLGILASFGLLAYVGRVREHSLGDSLLRFSDLERLYDSFIEGAGVQAGITDVQSYSSIHFELLDVLIHFFALLVGRELGEWTPQDAYTWLSIAAGILYLGAIWQVGRLLGRTTLQRTTYSALCITLGSLQLFFGYGESYTLVSAFAVIYVVVGLRALRGSSLLYPILCLLFCVALHAIAFSLIPSILYLIWLRVGRPGLILLSNRYLPLFLWPIVFIVATSLYAFFYPIRMPLWVPDESVTYALFSWGHARLLLNAALMVSPFGLLWGVASYFSNRSGQREDAFLSWAAWGALGLMFYHNAYLGGRDWDLLAFPGLFCMLWGLRALLRCAVGFRLWSESVIWIAVVPIMCMHTGAFVKINTDVEQVDARIQNLMQDSNQSLHYRYFSIGYWHQSREGEIEKSVRYYRMAALELAEQTHDHKQRYKYESLLGDALIRSQEYEEGRSILFNLVESVGMHDIGLTNNLIISTTVLMLFQLDRNNFEAASELFTNTVAYVLLLPNSGVSDELQNLLNMLIDLLQEEKHAFSYLCLANILGSYEVSGRGDNSKSSLYMYAEEAYEKSAQHFFDSGRVESAIRVLREASELISSNRLEVKAQEMEQVSR